MKYEEWLKEWLDNYIKPTAKERTHARYREIVYQHIIPHLGDYELNESTIRGNEELYSYKGTRTSARCFGRNSTSNA